MTPWVRAAAVLKEQRRVIAAWHARERRIKHWEDACREIPVGARPDPQAALSAAALRAGLLAYAGSIARVNSFQWHEEDKARDPVASDAAIAQVKRVIDASNQRRVDEIERLDLLIARRLERLGAPRRARGVLFSETPGSLVDRLSILALKIHHTEESRDAAREAEKRERFQARLYAQREQLADLSFCFDELMSGLLTGARRFKLYFQFKTYNDPETNAYLRRRAA